MNKKTNKLQKTKNITTAVLLVLCLLLCITVLYIVETSVKVDDTTDSGYDIIITEVCSSNGTIDYDGYGDFSDYIELYNRGETVDLKGFGITTNKSYRNEYTFDSLTFESGSYLVLWFNGKDVPFKLSSAGDEKISLVSPDAVVVCSVVTLPLGRDECMSWDGNEYQITTDATPGYPNTAAGLELFRKGTPMEYGTLIINEVLIDNVSTLPDFEGDYCDVIEIKNVSSQVINTNDYFISDGFDRKGRERLPDRELAPGEILVIYASGKGLTTDSGEFHTDFALSSGETLYLFYQNTYAEVELGSQKDNYSLCYDPNGYIAMLATPGYENTEDGYEQFCYSRLADSPSVVINEILLSCDLTPYDGVLRDVIELHNTTNSTVSLSGWYISDDEAEPYKFALPDVTVEANGFYVLYAEKSSLQNATGFKLSSGEAVYLTAPDYKRTAGVSCMSAGRGNSRYLDSDGEYHDGNITIGYSNDLYGKAQYAKATLPSGVMISEAVSLNTQYLAGPYGTYNDFCELYNNTNSDIDLTGYYLSDDPEEPMKASLDGFIIKANSYLVVILSPDGLNVKSGYKSVKLSLSSAGETLTLSQGSTIIDAMPMPALSANSAYGRAKGADGFSLLSEPTPGKVNGSAVNMQSSMPGASLAQGVYETAQTVELIGEGTIFYTLDCTVPTAASQIYTSPLLLTKTTVVRCAQIIDGRTISKTSTYTYIIGENDTLECMSLVCEPEDLFNYYHGIYADGPNAESEFPYNYANFYNDWEREANISFYGSDVQYSEDCGVKIFGGLSRALKKKSFALYFRTVYGASSLNAKVFADSDLECYEALVLRNSGQDYSKACMRDPLETKIANKYLGLDYQNNRPVALYLNGEYWGIYYIREKINENFIAGHYDVSSDSVTVTVANGKSSEEYTALIDYVKTHDLSVAANYEYVESLVDINNYIDYIVCEIIIANADNGNIKFYKIDGGKWRWIIYDVDQSFREANHKTVSAHLNPAGTGSNDWFSTALINALLKNSGFKDKFLTRMAYQLNYVWTPEIVNAEIDAYKAAIIGDMQKECDRWGKSYKTWETNVENMRYFINNRAKYVKEQVQSYFKLTDAQMSSYGF